MNSIIKESKNLSYNESTITVESNPSTDSTSPVSTYSASRKSAGKSGINYYWWGYKVYLDSNQTRQIRNALLAGATTAGIVHQFSPWFSAPTAVIKAISGAIAAGGTGLAGIIASNDNGRGIWIRVTGYAIYTGVGPQ